MTQDDTGRLVAHVLLAPQIPASGRIMVFTDSILCGLTNVTSANVLSAILH